MIHKTIKYRLYPSDTQKELLDKHINVTRYVYNLALETKKNYYDSAKINKSSFDLQKELTECKKEFPWLKEVNSQSLQQAISNMDVAFTNFFKGRTNFPKFKSKKKSTKSFQIPQSVKLESNKLFIPKFKEGIKVVVHRTYDNSKVKSATVSKTPTDKYFVSILFEVNEELPTKLEIKEETILGVDLGIKSYLVTSDGEIVDNPKYFKKAESKLKFIQRKYSKHKGKRTKKKLVRLHEKVVNKRKDFLHKLSKKLVVENHTIALETLSVKNMILNHKLAKSIQDASWGTFVSIIEYKAEWYGTNVIRIEQFLPSSKQCSCGVINNDLKLSDRIWTCSSCNVTHERDLLAANNIAKFAFKKYLSGTDRKNQEELSELSEAIILEATIPLG